MFRQKQNLQAIALQTEFRDRADSFDKSESGHLRRRCVRSGVRLGQDRSQERRAKKITKLHRSKSRANLLLLGSESIIAK